MAFGPLGLAIGYAGNIGVPQQNLLALSVGLLFFALVYFVLARFGDRNYDAGIQTLLLSVGAIAIGTSKLLSALFVIVFLVLGFVMIVAAGVLDPSVKGKVKRRTRHRRVS